MNNPLRNNSAKIDQLLNDDWKERSPEERRFENDNRSGRDKSYFEKGGKERRLAKERRHPEERRDGWMRVGPWCSVSVFDDKRNKK
jgi:hypothetical protein